MPEDYNPSVAERQPADDVSQQLAALDEAVNHGLIGPAAAERLNQSLAIGLLRSDSLQFEINRLLAAGPAADMALDAIAWAYKPGDVIELRALDPAKGGAVSLCGRLDVPVEREALKNFIRSNIGLRNIYLGINPRTEELAGTSRSASALNVAARRAVVLDFDNKSAPGTDPDWSMMIADLLSVDPLMVLDSGNGVPVWIKIEDVTGAELPASVGPLAAATKALGADNMADLPRVVRLPYTLNLPNESKRRRGAVVRLAVPRPNEADQ